MVDPEDELYEICPYCEQYIDWCECENDYFELE